MKSCMLFVFFMSLSLGSISAQSSDYAIDVGDVFIIGDASSNTYQHINFPRPNFIIKRGGIATFKNIKGKKVEITSVTKNSDGSSSATIKLLSEKYFFSSHKYVTLAIEEAINEKELIKV